MTKQTKYEAQAWMGSVLFHVVVFLFAAFCGGFAGVKAVDLPKHVEVVLYDADAAPGPGGGGGGGGGSPAPLAEYTAAAEEVVVSEPSSVAESMSMESIQADISNEAMSVAALPSASAAAGSVNVNRAENGMGTGGSGTGSGGGNGSGIGTGSGSGIGPGSGSGTGGGHGSGRGIGNGDGVDDGGGLRPKVPPQLLTEAEPVYPERLRRQGIEGSVRVRIVVSADGSVENTELIESSGYDEMDNAAITAASEYTFEPAENRYGEAVRCAISTTIHFRLN